MRKGRNGGGKTVEHGAAGRPALSSIASGNRSFCAGRLLRHRPRTRSKSSTPTYSPPSYRFFQMSAVGELYSFRGSSSLASSCSRSARLGGRQTFCGRPRCSSAAGPAHGLRPLEGPDSKPTSAGPWRRSVPVAVSRRSELERLSDRPVAERDAGPETGASPGGLALLPARRRTAGRTATRTADLTVMETTHILTAEMER